jgi:hypothetical protein
MKLLTRAALALTLVVQPFAPVLARYHHHHAYYHSYRHHALSPPSAYGGGYYTAVSGHQVHRPIQVSSRPAGATARCRDSSWSFSESHRGTCSHHGGVASWL